jgi:hypothetical protein
MCVEVLNGYRPAAHLRRLSLPKEASGVVAQAIAATDRVAELRRVRVAHAAGRRPTRAPGRRPASGARSTDRRDRGHAPAGVIHLQVCEPRPGAVEAAVLLVTGDRTWAMALRLELHQQSWCATALRLV